MEGLVRVGFQDGDQRLPLSAIRAQHSLDTFEIHQANSWFLAQTLTCASGSIPQGLGGVKRPSTRPAYRQAGSGQVASGAAEEGFGAGLLDVERVGAGGEGDGEGVGGEDQGAHEEGEATQDEETGDGGGPAGQAARGGNCGRLRVGRAAAPAPEGKDGARRDEGDAQVAPGAEGETGQALAALEGEEGGGQRDKPEAWREPPGDGEALEEVHGAPAL